MEGLFVALLERVQCYCLFIVVFIIIIILIIITIIIIIIIIIAIIIIITIIIIVIIIIIFFSLQVSLFSTGYFSSLVIIGTYLPLNGLKNMMCS